MYMYNQEETVAIVIENHPGGGQEDTIMGFHRPCILNQIHGRNSRIVSTRILDGSKSIVTYAVKQCRYCKEPTSLILIHANNACHSCNSSNSSNIRENQIDMEICSACSNFIKAGYNSFIFEKLDDFIINTLTGVILQYIADDVFSVYGALGFAGICETCENYTCVTCARWDRRKQKTGKCAQCAII